MNDYMLMFSLGPVQPFIMQARKTRDLWIGSLLLSKLMEAAMVNIKGQFVFPIKGVVENIPAIPNKYVALFDSLENAQQAAKQSIKQIRKHWEGSEHKDGISQVVWKSIINNHGDKTTYDIWQRQTNFDLLFEIYWAVVQRGQGEARKEYGVWLEETEALLAARKRLRDFKPQNEPGEKSIISGEREVLRRNQTQQESIRDFWKSIALKQSPKDIDQNGDERLDAIDTIKRFAMQVQAIPAKRPFPSTSSIATASFVEMLLDSSPQLEAFTKWEQFTRRGNLDSKPPDAARDIPYLAQKAGEEWKWVLRRDGDLYFPAVFAPRNLEKNYRITDPVNVIRNGRVALAALLKETDALKITRPTPYYAVMQMDGDNMGILLSGTAHEEEHQAISSALSTFARETAPELVEQRYPARLVYAGGDDVLAFAPLARDATSTNHNQPLSILALADELQSRYQGQVENALPPVQTPEDKERAQQVTASIGIAVAHHYTSLSYVLRSARVAEDAAKHRYGRNALVVTILRRSGEQTQVGCHWRYSGLEDDGQPIKLFSRFLQLFKEDTLSPKCVYILLEEASALVGLEKAARNSEIRRVLLRQLNLEQQTDEKKKALKKEVADLAEYIVELAEKMDKHEHAATESHQNENLAIELHSTGRRHGIVEALGWLLVMAFLARKDQEQE